MKRLFIPLMMALMAVGGMAYAQDGRLNAGQVLNIAVYCANGGVEIWHIDDRGGASQALTASRDQINAALANARSGQAQTVANGNYGVALTALPGIRLRASQNLEGREPYTFDFNGDSCAPVNLPPDGFASGNFAPGTLIGENNQPPASSNAAPAAAPAAIGTTGSISYTVQRGDSFYRIARNFNISVDELMQANGFNFGTVIYPSQQIIIPNQVVQAPANNAEAAAAPNTPQADASGNYLRDPSFESGYTNRGRPDLNVPGVWGLQVITSPRDFYWQNIVPVAFPRRDPPYLSGGTSLNFNRGYGTFSIILFQEVAVPPNANLQASAWAWYHTCDAGSQNCNNNSNPNFRVGIDPNGGANPYASEVVWGGFIAPQGTWGQATANARAQGGTVTLFISASQTTPRAINELYIDDAALIQVP